MSLDAFYDRPALCVELRRDEGGRPNIYIDSTGHVSGGVGRNLSAQPFAVGEIALMLGNDIDAAVNALDQRWPWWRTLDPVRARVMINMAFNLGGGGLSGFLRFLAAMQDGNWSEAVVQMRLSRWHAQVGARALRLEVAISTGVAP